MAVLLLPGDAQTSQVLSGKKFSAGQNYNVSGTMPDIGQQIITPSTSNQTIPAGYHDGTGYVVGDSDLIAGNIKDNVNLFGITGNFASDATAVAGDILSTKTAYSGANKITGTMTNRGAYNITPGVSNVTIPVGYHNGVGVVYGDADLVASNIKSGVNIFGVLGNLLPRYYASGSITADSSGNISVSGLAFAPTAIMVDGYSGSADFMKVYNANGGSFNNTTFTTNTASNTGGWTVGGNNFSTLVNINVANKVIYWYAWS